MQWGLFLEWLPVLSSLVPYNFRHLTSISGQKAHVTHWLTLYRLAFLDGHYLFIFKNFPLIQRRRWFSSMPKLESPSSPALFSLSLSSFYLLFFGRLPDAFFFYSGRTTDRAWFPCRYSPSRRDFKARSVLLLGIFFFFPFISKRVDKQQKKGHSSFLCLHARAAIAIGCAATAIRPTLQ